ncbi:unnamed protein product [Orchesella dallaii]|uniref:Poly [ADP-ribose] polymerase n=1 Tax=Orchesella dallaii TaxID=48710 RepID=A0ABP1QE24_9HEXA
MSQMSWKGKYLDVTGARPCWRKTPDVRKMDKEDLDLIVIPSTSTNASKSLKRKREESQIELSAVNILKGIPNLVNRKRAITSWLQVARSVSDSEEIHELILKYINNSQEHGYGIQVLNILQILRVGDVDYESKPEWRSKKRMLLWHGTSEENLASILLNGFQLPPRRNQMFGAGIYFADRVSKSANYSSCGRVSETKGYLLLCDVLVGQAYQALTANNMYTSPPVNCDSVMGNGQNIPNLVENVNFNGSCVPLGKTVVSNFLLRSCPLLYNEYVIYNPEKVKPLYLVKFEYGTAPVHHVG